MSYILITPARNEESHIGPLIESVARQTLRPTKWVIVNDGSSDATGDIVRRHQKDHEWIELIDRAPHRNVTFAAKARCFMAGYERVRELPCDVVGNLDADVTFEPDYLAFLMTKFSEDRELGVAGTIFVENGYNSGSDSFEGELHVAGGCQLFRKACLEQVGGYIPAKIGVDWIAVTTARMLGWKTRSFREKAFVHHRTLGTAGRSRLAASRLYGEKDYLLGWHPLYELFRVLHQVRRDPIAGLNIGFGYARALARGGARPINTALMKFHRAEQMAKLKTILKSVVTLKRVDSFTALPDRPTPVESSRAK